MKDFCSFCGKAILDFDDMVTCDNCGKTYHALCLETKGAYCTACGSDLSATKASAAEEAHSNNTNLNDVSEDGKKYRQEYAQKYSQQTVIGGGNSKLASARGRELQKASIIFTVIVTVCVLLEYIAGVIAAFVLFGGTVGIIVSFAGIIVMVIILSIFSIFSNCIYCIGANSINLEIVLNELEAIKKNSNK